MTQKENLRMSQASTIINWNQIYNILPYRLGLQFWRRKLDLVALWEEVLGEQPLTMKGSTPTLLTLNGKNFTLLPSKKTTTAGGWVTMDANSGKILWSTANPSNSTSAGPITVSNDEMACSLPDQLIQKDPYMQWTPKQEKFYGLMKLEPLCMVACQWVMDVYMLAMDTH